jgi:hypothetical protein
VRVAPKQRPLTAVQHAELQRRKIGGATHDSAERVHFTHHGALGYSSDSRVARHLADALERARDESNACAKTGGSHRGFSSRAATSYDDHVQLIFSRSWPVLRHIEKLLSHSG